MLPRGSGRYKVRPKVVFQVLRDLEHHHATQRRALRGAAQLLAVYGGDKLWLEGWRLIAATNGSGPVLCCDFGELVFGNLRSAKI